MNNGCQQSQGAIQHQANLEVKETLMARGEVEKSREFEAEDQEVKEAGGGGGGDIEVSEELGFPRIDERIEYSRLIASDPKEKSGSNGAPINESACVKCSVEVVVMALDKITVET